jgi:hypothetical protein
MYVELMNYVTGDKSTVIRKYKGNLNVNSPELD